MLEIGSVLGGRYKILDRIGGGMTAVYLATDGKLAQVVSIRVCCKEGADTQHYEVIRQGLVAEAEILKKLSHPGLPRIIDIIDTDDSFIIVRELIEGRSLDWLLDKRAVRDENGKVVEVRGFPEEDVIDWAKQLCDVFQYLHTLTPPIIYRDMKPSNLMLGPDGTIHFIDFGYARELKEDDTENTTLGTVGYAAPEQYGGAGNRQSDARTDIYNLGATLYHLVTGYSPHPNASKYNGMVPIRQINPALSPGLERIILKCCQYQPEDRYQDCLELRYALEHVDDDPVKDKRRFRVFLAVTAACVVLALAGIGFMLAANRAHSRGYADIMNINTSKFETIFADSGALGDTARTNVGLVI